MENIIPYSFQMVRTNYSGCLVGREFENMMFIRVEEETRLRTEYSPGEILVKAATTVFYGLTK